MAKNGRKSMQAAYAEWKRGIEVVWDIGGLGEQD